jgi:hypothetical protein
MHLTAHVDVITTMCARDACKALHWCVPDGAREQVAGGNIDTRGAWFLRRRALTLVHEESLTLQDHPQCHPADSAVGTLLG